MCVRVCVCVCVLVRAFVCVSLRVCVRGCMRVRLRGFHKSELLQLPWYACVCEGMYVCEGVCACACMASTRARCCSCRGTHMCVRV